MTKYTVKITTQFRKDYKPAIKRGLKIDLLEQIVASLADGVALPDWLLVYRMEKAVRHFSVSAFHVLLTFGGVSLGKLLCIPAPITLFLSLLRISLKASLILLVCVPLIPVTIMAVQALAKRLLGKYWGIYMGLEDRFLENSYFIPPLPTI